MDERQKEECTSVTTYPTRSGPSSVLENYDHAKIAWETLATNYKGMAKVNIVKLHNTRRDFESLQMKEIEDIDSFLNRVMIVVNQLKIYGEGIKDQTMVEKVLRSLFTKFDAMVVAMEEAKDLASLTVDEFVTPSSHIYLSNRPTGVNMQ